MCACIITMRSTCSSACIARGSLAEVRIYFPDPWPKKRQQKRRLIQPDFVALLAERVLAGRTYCIWRPIGRTMPNICSTCSMHAPAWRNLRRQRRTSSPRPAWRIETHFEKRGLRLGHGVWDLLYERRSDDLADRSRPNKKHRPDEHRPDPHPRHDARARAGGVHRADAGAGVDPRRPDRAAGHRRDRHHAPDAGRAVVRRLRRQRGDLAARRHDHGRRPRSHRRVEQGRLVPAAPVRRHRIAPAVC